MLLKFGTGRVIAAASDMLLLLPLMLRLYVAAAMFMSTLLGGLPGFGLETVARN